MCFLVGPGCACINVAEKEARDSSFADRDARKYLKEGWTAPGRNRERVSVILIGRLVHPFLDCKRWLGCGWFYSMSDYNLLYDTCAYHCCTLPKILSRWNLDDCLVSPAATKMAVTSSASRARWTQSVLSPRRLCKQRPTRFRRWPRLHRFAFRPQTAGSFRAK